MSRPVIISTKIKRCENMHICASSLHENRKPRLLIKRQKKTNITNPIAIEDNPVKYCKGYI